MSLLHQENQPELDDAARGESLTRGTSHVVWASIAATVIVSVAIALYIIAGQKPPVATGEVVSVWAHPMHTVTPAFDAGGAPVPQDSFDQVLVFTRVRLHNQSKGPLFLHQILTNLTLADGIHSSYAAETSQYDRVFLAYPDLAAWHESSLSPESTLEPGQSTEGTFVSAFRLSKEQWDARKGLNYSFSFRYQPVVTLTPKVAVTEH
ncbi:MAG TPA: hypothetical protein VMU48_05005 [Terracidiphilus sp.]|nr:hypothetical protein [Terracidiphilus sp.]